jgi:hypothetical protein
MLFMFNENQLAAAYRKFTGEVIELAPAKPRKEEITFNLDKALYNRPERRGDSRRRDYVTPMERF